jgi:hypothetical protein
VNPQDDDCIHTRPLPRDAYDIGVMWQAFDGSTPIGKPQHFWRDAFGLLPKASIDWDARRYTVRGSRHRVAAIPDFPIYSYKTPLLRHGV